MASTAPTFASTASRATRLLWISDSTAMRTGTNLSVRPSPRPTAARGRVTRVGRRRVAAGRDDRETVRVETRCRHRPKLDRPAAERGERPFRSRDLVGDVAALPGDQAPPGREQRNRQLDQLGERRDGAGG